MPALVIGGETILDEVTACRARVHTRYKGVRKPRMISWSVRFISDKDYAVLECVFQSSDGEKWTETTAI